jgi:hypothetical protein
MTKLQADLIALTTGIILLLYGLYKRREAGSVITIRLVISGILALLIGLLDLLFG